MTEKIENVSSHPRTMVMNLYVEIMPGYSANAVAQYVATACSYIAPLQCCLVTETVLDSDVLSVILSKNTSEHHLEINEI